MKKYILDPTATKARRIQVIVKEGRKEKYLGTVIRLKSGRSGKESYLTAVPKKGVPISKTVKVHNTKTSAIKRLAGKHPGLSERLSKRI